MLCHLSHMGPNVFQQMCMLFSNTPRLPSSPFPAKKCSQTLRSKFKEICMNFNWQNKCVLVFILLDLYTNFKPSKRFCFCFRRFYRLVLKIVHLKLTIYKYILTKRGKKERKKVTRTDLSTWSHVSNWTDFDHLAVGIR